MYLSSSRAGPAFAHAGMAYPGTSLACSQTCIPVVSSLPGLYRRETSRIHSQQPRIRHSSHEIPDTNPAWCTITDSTLKTRCGMCRCCSASVHVIDHTGFACHKHVVWIVSLRHLRYLCVKGCCNRTDVVTFFTFRLVDAVAQILRCCRVRLTVLV